MNGLGNAEYFAKNARAAIADEKCAGNCAGVFQLELIMAEETQKEKEHNAFKGGFIELAWVAHIRAAVWEYHTPGDIGGTAEMFAIDEIGDAAEKQPKRGCGAEDISEREQIDVVFFVQTGHRRGKHRAGHHEMPCRHARPQRFQLGWRENMPVHRERRIRGVRQPQCRG